MRYFVGLLCFVFIMPICVIAGFFGSCLFAGLSGGNETLGITLVILGPLVGLIGSIALTVLIVRSMKAST
jgi:hypothetical protein